MISYSRRALSALIYLFRPFNDLDVFVEDKASRNLYEVLINRMLEGQAMVSRVFQLGGRDEVIEACQGDQSSRDRNRIYIIDGDYSILTGTQHPGLKHLYRLTVYCSENLVVSPEAMTQVAYECNPNESKEDLAHRLRLQQFLDQLAEGLSRLLVIYLVAHVHNDSIQTMSFNVTQLILDNGDQVELAHEKVEARIADITLQLQALIGAENLRRAIQNAEKVINDLKQSPLRVMSGKTYIIPLVYHFLHRNASYKGSSRELVVRLARHCELDIDPGLKEAINLASREEYQFAA